MARPSWLLVAFGITGESNLYAQQPTDQSADEAAIRNVAGSYAQGVRWRDFGVERIPGTILAFDPAVNTLPPAVHCPTWSTTPWRLLKWPCLTSDV
jgi:hypothetical protein